MVNARKIGWLERAVLTIGSFGTLFSGGCVGEEGGFINPYALAGAGLKAGAGFSQSAGAGAGLYAVGEGVQATGQYNAARDASAAGASQTNVYNGGGNGRVVAQSQPTNVIKTPEGSYFDITPDGITHTVVPGLNYQKYVEENKNEFSNGYFVQIHDAEVGDTYTVTHNKFVDKSK